MIVGYFEGIQKGLIAVEPTKPQESFVSSLQKSGKSLVERVKGMFVRATKNYI